MYAIGRRQSALKMYFSGRVEGLSVYHHALMAFAGWFFVFTVIGDTYQVVGMTLSKRDVLMGFVLNVLFISVFFVFPCAFAGWGVYHIKNYDHRFDRKFFLPKLFITSIGCVVCAFICVLCPLAIFVFMDMFIANTAVPLVTIVCGVLWLLLGTNETRKLPLKRRALIVTSMFLLILSIKYIDWNSRKPFMRDLYQIRNGMTGIQVEKIMRQHNYIEPYSGEHEHLDTLFTGTHVFRHTIEAWGNSDWGIVTFQDGRVVNVEFSHD